MKTTIDHAGRLVLPKAIREVASLQPGSELEVRYVGDHIELEPVPLEVEMVKRGDFIVAVPKGRRKKRKALTVQEVEGVRQAILAERRLWGRSK